MVNESENCFSPLHISARHKAQDVKPGFKKVVRSELFNLTDKMEVNIISSNKKKKLAICFHAASCFIKPVSEFAY